MSGKAVVQAEVKSLLDADGISFDSHFLIHVVLSICKNTTFVPHVKHICHFPSPLSLPTRVGDEVGKHGRKRRALCEIRALCVKFNYICKNLLVRLS